MRAVAFASPVRAAGIGAGFGDPGEERLGDFPLRLKEIQLLKNENLLGSEPPKLPDSYFADWAYT